MALTLYEIYRPADLFYGAPKVTWSVHLVLSWPRHNNSWERDNMSWPRDINLWERHINSWERLIMSWPRDHFVEVTTSLSWPRDVMLRERHPFLVATTYVEGTTCFSSGHEFNA